MSEVRERSLRTRRLVESGIMIAVGTVLSLLSFQAPWAFGGSVTICAMLPLVFLAHRYGTRWGVFSAFVYALLQMVLGFQNVRYGRNFMEMASIALLDYILAFSVIGLAAVFNRTVKNRLAAIVAGIVFTYFLRFLCHFISGWLIWTSLYPPEGMAPAWYSLVYNGGYMLPETIIAVAGAVLSYPPLKRFWHGEDLR